MAAATFDLNPGDVVAGRYRVENAIGRGGFGTVYRATHLELNTPVALKVMHMRHHANTKEVKRFEREAALATRLQHQNVVATLDYGHTAAGLPFIVFELLSGHALSHRLKTEGALSVWRTGQIVLQVLKALEAAHALEIVHRDIKPANIFLCAGRTDDFVKVLDFGIAKALSPDDSSKTKLTETGQMIGTPQYMAPEQVKGGAISPNCDLYSLVSKSFS